MHLVRSARDRRWANAGIIIAARIAMIKMTVTSSIRVNPRWEYRPEWHPFSMFATNAPGDRAKAEGRLRRWVRARVVIAADVRQRDGDRRARIALLEPIH